MRFRRANYLRVLLMFVAAAAFTAISRPAFAQTDEIQVYNAEIAEVGKFNLMLHSNFTPIGRKEADFPGGIIPNHSVNGALEWAWGVTPWFEQGLYFPVYSAYSPGRDGSLNGFKIRELFVKPHAADHTFFYGVNFEFSVNYHYWEDHRFSSEVRPIVGVHLRQWDLIYNPIVDTDYTGGFGGLEFVPAGRIAYNFNKTWSEAIESYSDFGQLRDFVGAREQFQEVWATTNYSGKVWSIETGAGVGVTHGADKFTIKFMISRDLP